MAVELRQAVCRMIMTFGSNNKNAVLSKAVLQDLNDIKALVDQHKRELGFVVRGALETSIRSSELIIATIENTGLVGFIHYRHRKDQQTTLYNIAVNHGYRYSGLGSQLIDALRHEAQLRQQKYILLKCPEELPANDFYRSYGFILSGTEKGKKKPLSIWKLQL
jgi:ribosomal protein S18 acetylase RimI-like enzyme